VAEKPKGKSDGEVLGIIIVVPDDFKETFTGDEKWQRDWIDPADGLFCILPENWETFRCFQWLETQWEIVSGMGGNFYNGIPVDRIDRVLARATFADVDAELTAWHDIRAMEAKAKPQLNSKIKRESGK
jgi:hypothetical protein